MDSYSTTTTPAWDITEAGSPTTTTTTPSPGGDTPSSASTGASAGLAGAIFFGVVIVVVVVMRRRMRHKKKKRRRGGEGGSVEEGDTSGSSDEEASSDEEHKPHPDTPHDTLELSPLEKYRRQQSVKSTDSFMMPMWLEVDADIKAAVSSSLIDTKTLTLGNVLGKGQFGMVYQALLSKTGRTSNNYGEISHEKVAVKTLKGSNIDKETIEAFLKEGMIMKEFEHKNVLGLVGVALGDHGIPMIVLPFMANGNLKKYIGKSHLMITVRELLVFGREVACGMKYLSDNKFVHRDLAARNCMLDDLFCVKVADFGLSRDMYEKDYYSSTDAKAKLPVKWMAIEAIASNRYTTKSDVWSYGVLLWELMTRGATPYPDVGNWDVVNYIRAGRRMTQPHLCPDVIYTLMRECWNPIPADRPSFDAILARLDEILDPATRHSSVDEAEDDVDYYDMYVNVEFASDT